MREIGYMHEAAVVPGVQNGLAQLAGAHLPAPDAPVIRAAMLKMGGPQDNTIPIGGDVIAHYPQSDEKGWPPDELLGKSEVIGVLRVERVGYRLTIEGHEASWLELQELAEGLGIGKAEELVLRVKRCGDHAAVFCW